MTTRTGDPNARREFLKFLAASPYVAALGGVAAFVQQRAFAQNTQEASNVIAGPADALDVFDFQEAARRKVQPAHWVFMASGVDDDATLRANREGFNTMRSRKPRRSKAWRQPTQREWCWCCQSLSSMPIVTTFCSVT